MDTEGSAKHCNRSTPRLGNTHPVACVALKHACDKLHQLSYTGQPGEFREDTEILPDPSHVPSVDVSNVLFANMKP